MARGDISIDTKILEKQIKKAMKVNPAATVKAVNDCLLHLSAESAKRAPIESGDLRNNCRAEMNGRTVFEKQKSTGVKPAPATSVSGSVGYSLPYALRQHEDLGYSHNRTDGYKRSDGTTINMIAGGEAKYLENPFNGNEQRYIKRIKKVVEDSLG